MNDPSRPRLTVLISGGGTTLRNLIEQIEQGRLPGEIALVVSSSSKAAGLRHALAANLPTKVIEYDANRSTADFSRDIFNACRNARSDLVVMGGFLKRVEIPDDFVHRVMNIHPSLIPAFCGKGFYGRRVHKAVLDYGAKVSGCTVHFVDNQYDHGPIISQRVVPVLDDDTPESLARRVFEQECAAYPEAIRWFIDGRLVVEGRRVRLTR